MTSPPLRRIGLIEDDRLFQDFVRLLLETSGRYRAAWICAAAEEGLKRLAAGPLDGLILDLTLPGRSGLSLLPELLAAQPGLPVLVLSGERDDARVLDALRLGACGYVLKDGAGAELLEALDDALAGGAPMSAPIARTVLAHLRTTAPVGAAHPAEEDQDLTPREAEVLALVAAGLADKEIADRLAISRSTVKNHLTHIYEKWRVRSRTEAAVRFERLRRPN